MTGERIVLVFTGGDPIPAVVAAALPVDALVVAADSGLDHALEVGRHVDIAVGDFDSVSAEALARAEAAGTTIERHPVAKDETDLELALDRAVALGADRIIVVGGHGGRVDHFLANAFVLSAPRYADVRVEARMGRGRVHVVRKALDLAGHPGDLVTLLAIAGPVEGVTTSGLLYPLRGESLQPGSSRGVSNEFDAERARVEVEAGTLLVVTPGDQSE